MIVLKARKQDRATPLLEHLHWLHIEKRMSYKVALKGIHTSIVQQN